jgi:hypothetical protein
MNLTMKKLKFIAPVLIAVACLGLQQAKADMFSFDLNSANIAGTGPFVNVNINRTDSTHATFTFTSLTNNGNIYLMGAQGAVALNLLPGAYGFNPLGFTGTNSGTGFTPGPLSFAGGGNEDGFGSFNFTVDSFDGFTHSSDQITFTLTNISGTWASAMAILTGNSQGLLAAAHIFVTSSPANASNGAINTGFASGNGQGVPDGGATAMLLGAAFGALGMARRVLRI